MYQGIFWSKNPGYVVLRTSIIKVPTCRHWKIFRIERSCVVDTEGSDNREDKNTNHGVGNGVERKDERTGQESCDNSPIECNRKQSKSSLASKQLIDDDIVRSSPADEGKGAKEGSNPEWEPFPNKDADKHNEEVLVSSYLPRS